MNTIHNVTVENSTNPYGPKYYFLHRDKITAEIAAIQKRRGVANPCCVTQWRLAVTDDKTTTYLAPMQGRRVRFPNE
jgi:hypothetical protein